MHSLYPVDERISDKLASLIEPFTVGCRAARRGMIPAGTGADAEKMVYVKGQNAVVFGAGTIGIAAAVAFKYFGMDKVMVCDVSDYRLSLAENLGFEICNILLIVILLADSLYASEPVMDICCDNGWEFIIRYSGKGQIFYVR